MTKKTQSGAEQLQAAITAKQAEIETIGQEVKAAAGDVAAVVAAEKKDRRARAELEALQTAYKAATYQPPEPTDTEELLKGLLPYQEKYNQRLDTIRESIAEADRNAAEIEKGLQDAAEQADAKKTILLSGQKEENKAARKHLEEMLTRAMALPVYPEGAIEKEWAAVCGDLLPEWENKLLEVRTLAEAYKTAAESLLQMNETIKAARAEFMRRAGNEACSRFFTAGKDAEGMTIDKTYLARISNIFNPIIGQAI